MKKVLFFATIVAMTMAVAMPVNAQSRKDKKAAEKEQWEMQQQQQREEAALRHQMKMDSLRNVQRQNEEIEAEAKAARLQEEERRRVAEEEARARQKRAEEAAAMEEKEVNEPCMDVTSSSEVLRARGIGESLNQQGARTKAQAVAVRDLAGKIGTAVQSLLKYYMNDESTKMVTDETAAGGLYSEEKMENMIKQKIDQYLAYNTFCEKTTSYLKNNNKVYKCYMVVQTGKDEVLKPVFSELQKENSERLKINYEKFSEEFDKEFQKQSEPAL